MSETPRTDKEATLAKHYRGACKVVTAAAARQLERELRACEQERQRLADELATYDHEEQLMFLKAEVDRVKRENEALTHELNRERTISAATIAELRAELERVTKERDSSMQMIDRLTMGFDRSLARVLSGDLKGAQHELMLTITALDQEYDGATYRKLESALAESRKQCVALRISVEELVDAMRRYEMEVDTEAPFTHRELMGRSDKVLAQTSDLSGKVLCDAAELEKLREDQQRLDWLEDNQNWLQQYWNEADALPGQVCSFKSAIDLGRKSQRRPHP